MEQVRGFFKKVIKYITKPEMRVLPGQLAFFTVISLIPLLALVGTIAGYFSVSTDKMIHILNTVLPFEMTESIISYVSGKGITFNISIFFISAFILASNGCHSMIITSNEIYKVESKGILSRRLKAIAMTFILVLLFLFLLLVPVFGDTIFNILTSNIPNKQTVSFAYNIYKLIQYPITLVLVFYNIKLLYTVAPDRKIKAKTTNFGSIFTTIGWVLSTKIYSIYAGSFSNYNIFYGSISNILFLLMWVYILSYIFVLGMAFNASATRKDDYETMQMAKIEEKEKN